MHPSIFYYSTSPVRRGHSVVRQQTVSVARHTTITAMDAMTKKAKDAALKKFVYKKVGDLQLNKTYPVMAMQSWLQSRGPRY